MSASMPGALKAEPNLTPLLDLVFQLVTFFMLLVNFGKDDFNSQVRLPSASSARPVEAGTDEDRLVLHINKFGQLLARRDEGGDDPLELDRAARFLREQAVSVRENLRQYQGKTINPGEKLPTTLVIRADKETQCEDLLKLISAAQKEGFQNFSLKVLTR